MKVLLVNSLCGVASTGKIVIDLLEVLESRGHTGKIAFGLEKAKNVDVSKTIKFNNKLGYYVHNILAKITDRTGLYSTFQTKKLIKAIEKYNPDLIHLHTIHGYYINYQVLFKYLKKANKPVVWSLHDCWTFTGHCTHFINADCYKWKTKCYDCPLIKVYPKCYFKGDVTNNFLKKKKAFTSVDNLTLVLASQWIADFVKQSFFKKYDVKVIKNGIDLKIFRPRKSDFREKNNIKDEKIVLGVANVWNKQKGFPDMLKLADILGQGYKVVMVGLTEQQKNSLPSNVIGVTRTENAEKLAEIYSEADVFVNPTYEETFSLVNIEAQACGTPVVVYRTGGCPETVLDNFGEVVDCGDVDTMAQGAKFWADKKHDIKLNDVSFLSKEYCYEKYVDLYEELYK